MIFSMTCTGIILLVHLRTSDSTSRVWSCHEESNCSDTTIILPNTTNVSSVEFECYGFSSCAHTNILSQLDVNLKSNPNATTNSYYPELSMSCLGSYSCYNVSFGSNIRGIGGLGCDDYTVVHLGQIFTQLGLLIVMVNVHVLTLFGIINNCS